MHDLEITWPEGQARFSPDDSPIEIGRSPDAAVILTEPSVSRSHIEFIWTGTAWTATDASTHGSFDPIGVRLAPNWTVGTNTTIRLGGVEGVELRIELVTTRPEGFDQPLGAPPPPEVQDLPPGPPGLADLPPAPAPAPAAYDAPPPAPPAYDAPPQPEVPPPAYDGPPASFDAPPQPDAPPAAYDSPAQAEQPPPAFDAPPQPPAPVPAEPEPVAESPSAFDEPGAFDPSSLPDPPMGYGAPAPGDPSAFDPSSLPDPPSVFDAPPPDQAAPAVPSAFDAPPPPDQAAPAVPSAFDAPLPPEQAAPVPSAFDAPPPPEQAAPVPSAFDVPPQPEQAAPVPSAFDAPPQPDQAPVYDPPPQPEAAPSFDAAPPAYDPPGYDPPAYDPPAYDPPGGVMGAGVADIASTTAISDATIQLSIDGNDYTFLPGTEVTVGRDPSCLVTVDERHSLVSRRHLKIEHRDGDWWLEDFSSKGTFVDGRQISSVYKASGAFMVQLGDDDAGTPLRVITAGEHRAPRGQNLGLIAAIALLAVVAAIALFFAFRGGGESDETLVSSSGDTTEATSSETTAPIDIEDASAAVLIEAKQSTVLLLAEEGLGSGFFVSDNLIVTNQHVAALADSLFVAVSRETDEPAIVEFEATTVARHPFLDIAVLQLTFDLDGNPVETSGLPAARVGETASLTLGDDVYNTGFSSNLSVVSSDDMGELLLPPVGTTSGEAASFSIWPGCSNPNFESFIPIGSPPGVGCAPDGDVDRGIVITTFSSGQGASGSPVFSGDEVVAVVFAGPLDEANAGRNITTASFSAWLQEIIAANA